MGKGVKMGWYANNCGCAERETQPGGHTLQDAEMAAQLGFDEIKVDGCGPAMNMSEWAQAINATGRPMLVEDCLNKHYWIYNKSSPATADILQECPSNMYRTSQDIAPQFLSAMHNVNVGHNFVKQYSNSTHPASRPGCWNYPDMLQVGNNMNLNESKTHFALWCITSSPLILGFDMANTTVYDELYPIITNPRALAINQRWAGWPGSLSKNSSTYFDALTYRGAEHFDPRLQNYATWQIWNKPLPAQSGYHLEAVLIINLSDGPQDVPLKYADVNPAFGEKVVATDVWTGEPMSMPDGSTTFRGIQSHDSVFILLSASLDRVFV